MRLGRADGLGLGTNMQLLAYGCQRTICTRRPVSARGYPQATPRRHSPRVRGVNSSLKYEVDAPAYLQITKARRT